MITTTSRHYEYDEDLSANDAFDSEGHIAGDLNNDGICGSNNDDIDDEVQRDLFDELFLSLLY